MEPEMLERAMEKASKQLDYTLRQRQKDIVRAFVRGRDVFGVYLLAVESRCATLYCP